MKYLEIAVSTNEFASELVAEFLSELTGEGVAIYSKNVKIYLISQRK